MSDRRIFFTGATGRAFPGSDPGDSEAGEEEENVSTEHETDLGFDTPDLSVHANDRDEPEPSDSDGGWSDGDSAVARNFRKRMNRRIENIRARMRRVRVLREGVGFDTPDLSGTGHLEEWDWPSTIERVGGEPN